MILPIITERQFDTILAALRYYQSALDRQSAAYLAVYDIAAAHGAPLTTDQIDVLCERLNTQTR